MPSSTPKQAKFMKAVAHGFKPTGEKGPPVAVAKEFVKADKTKGGGRIGNLGGFAHPPKRKK